MASVNPGDIFYSSWGYDQTNCDFYQVLSVTASFARLRLLKNEQTEGDDWTGKVAPLKDQFAEGAAIIRRKIQRLSDGQAAFAITSFASAFPWDGAPKSFTSYA